MKLLAVLAFLLFSVLPALAASVVLTWSPSTDNPGGSGVAGYHIYRNGVLVGTSATTTFTDTGLATGTGFNYTVTAFDNAGNESAQSAIATVTTLTAFIPLHKYYISPTGSDAANGLTPATAWATANHSVVCGDVLIAAAGSYGSRFGNATGDGFSAVSGCPSTTGGIDGAGGVYFAILLCGGPDLMSCNADGGGQPAFEVDKSNWAIEGFHATMNTNGDRGCFSALGTSIGTMWHHVAWINNIASTCDLAGFGTGNVGIGNAGLDQTAVVGGIAFNAANSFNAVCGSGISVIPAPQNTDSGTHIFISQSFIYKSTNASGAGECVQTGFPSAPHSDGEAIIFDTWAGNGNAYAQKGVVKNNVMWLNGGACFEAFPQGNGTTDDQAKLVINSNTCLSNNQDARAACQGELFLNGIYPTLSSGGTISVTNNIFLATLISCGNALIFSVEGAMVTAESSHTTALASPPLTISGNYIFNNVPPTHPNVYNDGGVGALNTELVNNTTVGCTPSASPPCFNAPGIFGTNTLNDPGLTNPASLPTAAPDCTGYRSTTDCMNTKYSVYANVTPTIASTSIGYQPPSTTCAADADYPTWLKGIVYLQVSGSDIVVGNDLVTKPCGL